MHEHKRVLYFAFATGDCYNRSYSGSRVDGLVDRVEPKCVERPKGKGAVENGNRLAKGEDRADTSRVAHEESATGGSLWRRSLPQDLVELVIATFRIGNVVAQAAGCGNKISLQRLEQI